MNVSHRIWIIVALVFVTFIACEDPETQDRVVLNTKTGVPEIDKISALIEKDSSNADLYYQRAELYAKREVYTEAIRDFDQAIRLDSTQAMYYHGLADALLDNQMSFEAVETMKKARKLFPERVGTALKLSEFQLIVQKYLEALQTVNAIIAMKPTEAEAYFMKGMIYRDMGSNAQAMESFQKAVEFNPELSEAFLYMGDMMSEENPEMALRFYDNAILVDPKNPINHHSKALHLHQRGQLQEAIIAYKEAHLLDMQYSEAFFNAGLLYLELDSIPKSYNMFNIAVETEPSFAKAYYYRGLTAEIQGNTAQARGDYQMALQYSPNMREAQKALSNLEE